MLDWTVVLAAAAVVSAILGWTYKLYYKYVIDNEKEVRKIAEKDIEDQVKQYKKITKDSTPNVFVEYLSLTASLIDLVDETKTSFELNMFFGGIITMCLFAAATVFSQAEWASNAFAIGVIGILYILGKAYEIYQNKIKIERYLNDEPLDDIFPHF